MADKTTTLTTQTGDSIYPNVLDENIPDTIARVSDVNNLKTNVETAYLTKANAEATYQTQTGRADYVSKTYGDSTYATITQLGGKQDKLTAGSNITIEGTTIAAVRPENRALYGDLAATDGEFTGGGSGGGSSATTGGGSNVNVLEFDINQEHFTGDIDLNKVNIIKNSSYETQIITSTFDLGRGKLGALLVPNLTDDGYPDGGILVYSMAKSGDNTVVDRTLMHARYFSHFIILSSNTLGNINFNYYDTRKEPHTINTLKTALKGRTVSCSGYINNGGTKEIATYIEGASNGSLSVGWFNISDGSTGRTTLDNTINISDTVKPVEQVAMDNHNTYDEGKAIGPYPRPMMVGGTKK